ncbi:MAG: class E sortase [Gaiellales bacterium]|nr:class E sortase [Gaiellales bacterium]
MLGLLYPVGTWAYTWIVHANLVRQLSEQRPGLEGDIASFFREGDMVAALPVDVTVAPEHDAGRQAQWREEQARREGLLRAAADEFAASVVGMGGRAIGRIVIPKIGVDVIVLEGTGTQDLREGPGHWPETPFPGQGGNFVVSGHRTTYGAPFFRLDNLEAGDEIQLVLPYVAAVYRVWRSIVVLPYETQVVAQRGVEEISLATCHPIYSAAQRLVVQAQLVEYQLLERGE